MAQQGGQSRPIGRLEPDELPVELALQHRQLVAEGEDLSVLVMAIAWQEPQQRDVLVMPG